MILVALGANLPGRDGAAPLETCRRAAVCLDRLAGLTLKGLSRWYATAPVPASGQPPYINAVALLTATGAETIDPADLLAALQAIEAAFGRTRGEPNAARALDLDIVAIGDLVRAAPDPILPHPRVHERAFVLTPLIDVAPDWVHPVSGRRAVALLAGLPVGGIRTIAG